MMALTRKAIFLAIPIVLACSKDDDIHTRSFLLGFTPMPFAVSEASVQYTYDRIAADADIVNHHFDNGIPWNEALHDLPFHQNIVSDWEFRKANTSSSHKVYVSVTPLNERRTGLANVRGESENMPLPSPWSEYSFRDPQVRTAYVKYCQRVIDFFEPDFFNMAIEANLLFVHKREEWSAYLSFHEQVYHALKECYPDLPIFTSVVGAYMLPGFVAGNDHVEQRLAVLQLMENSDYYGISFYPYLSNYLGNPYPSNTLDELFNISEKPVAITETAYSAETFSMMAPTGLITVESNQLKQQAYLNDLLSACERRKAVFVINFAIRDYDQLWQQLGAPSNVPLACRDAGLYDENGVPRLAWVTWKEYQSRKYQPQNSH